MDEVVLLLLGGKKERKGKGVRSGLPDQTPGVAPVVQPAGVLVQSTIGVSAKEGPQQTPAPEQPKAGRERKQAAQEAMTKQDAEMQELRRKFEAMEREYKERIGNLKAELEKNRADTDVLQKALAKEQETRMRVQGRVNDELHQKCALSWSKSSRHPTEVSQTSKKLVGSPDAQASVVSVEPPNLQGIPVVELNAGAPGPLESASSVAAPGEAGKGEANSGVPRPEVRVEILCIQGEIPVFVPQQSDKGNDEVVENATGSVSAPVVGLTGSPASVIPGGGGNCYAAMVAEESREADDAKRATDAKWESEELDKIAARLGVEKALVRSDGNCVLSAARVTALKLGEDVRMSVPEMRKELVDLMRRSLDLPAGHGAMTLREAVNARAPGNLSEEARRGWVEDTLAQWEKDGTYLEQHAFLFLSQLLGCPIVVVQATTTYLFGTVTCWGGHRWWCSKTWQLAGSNISASWEEGIQGWPAGGTAQTRIQ